MVKKSNLNGYYLRLKKLGYKPGVQWTKPYTVLHSKNEYIRTFWTFTKDKFKVVFYISTHGYRLIIKEDGETVLDTGTRKCWSALEADFLCFYKQERPLALERLSIGQQRKDVQKWMLKKRKEQKTKDAIGRKSKAKRSQPLPALPNQLTPRAMANRKKQ